MQDQIDLIKEAMKQAGVWSKEVPDWIRNYNEGPIDNIWQWLQFIHLPMKSNGNLLHATYLAPQISAYTREDAALQHILQLVIELDAISPTIDTSESLQLKKQNISKSI